MTTGLAYYLTHISSLYRGKQTSVYTYLLHSIMSHHLSSLQQSASRDSSSYLDIKGCLKYIEHPLVEFKERAFLGKTSMQSHALK